MARSFFERKRPSPAADADLRAGGRRAAAENPWVIPDYEPGKNSQALAQRTADWFSQFQPRYGTQMDDLLKGMGGFDATKSTTPYTDPYAGDIRGAAGKMGNAGFDENALASFMQRFSPGGGMSASGVPITTRPTMGRPSGASAFAGGGSNVMAPNTGAGGDFIANLLRSGTQTPTGFEGFGGDYGTARDAQLQQLLSMGGAPGISPDRRNELFTAQMDPVEKYLSEARGTALEGLSGRGMGRSSEAVGNIEGDYMRNLTDAATQVGAGLTQQDLDLAQRQREAAISGLDTFAGTGVNAELGAGSLRDAMRGTADRYNLGLTGPAGDLANLLSSNQRWATETGFNQGATRAGMDADLTSDRNRELLDLYGLDINRDESMGNMSDRNLQTLLGAGLRAQDMDQDAMGSYANYLLNASGRGSDIAGMNQGNIFTALGMNQNQQMSIADQLRAMLGYGADLYGSETDRQIAREGGETDRMGLRQQERLNARDRGFWNQAKNAAGRKFGERVGGFNPMELFGG